MADVSVTFLFIHISFTYVSSAAFFVLNYFLMHCMIILPYRLDQVAAVGETVVLLQEMLQWFVI